MSLLTQKVPSPLREMQPSFRGNRLPPFSLDRPDREPSLCHPRLELSNDRALRMAVAAPYGKGNGEAWITHRAMVAFARVLHHQLPVGSFDERAFMCQLGVRQIMRRQQG